MNWQMKFRKFFNGIFWFEWVYMGIFSLIIILLGIFFKSSALVIFNSLFGIFTTFFIAKGKILGTVLGLVQSSLYIVMCYYNQYYGEILVGACFTIPVYIASIISWTKNLNKRDKIVRINKNFSNLEWVLSLLADVVFSVGIYYLLRHFNTANLLVSTFSVGFCAMARYLTFRRSEYNFIFQILNNLMRMCLWIFVVVQNHDISYITTIVQYVMYLSLNTFGVFNWIKIKKVQRLRKLILKKKSDKLMLDKDYMKEN